MHRRVLLSLTSAAAAVCLAYGTAQAAPATGSLADLKTLGLEQNNIEQVHRRCHRRCWRQRGHWHCRRWCRRWW